MGVWTKLIRNHTAIQYLFNAATYDFNYQYHNRLPSRIQIYPVKIFSFIPLFHLSSRVMNLRQDVFIKV